MSGAWENSTMLGSGISMGVGRTKGVEGAGLSIVSYVRVKTAGEWMGDACSS